MSGSKIAGAMQVPVPTPVLIRRFTVNLIRATGSRFGSRPDHHLHDLPTEIKLWESMTRLVEGRQKRSSG